MRIEPLHLRLCPVCGGESARLASCHTCAGTGVLDQNDQPFEAPPPFDGWTPAQLVKLDQASRQRDAERRDAAGPERWEGWRMARTRTGEAVALPERPRRLTLSEIVELLLRRSSAEHSSVKLTRNAKGDTQIEVHVRTGDEGLETIEQARAKAEEQYDHLRQLYPMQ